MRILWVKAGGLVPPDTGGKLRSYNILSQLAKQHAITFFSFYATHENDMHEVLRQKFERVILMPLALPPAKGPGELLDYAAHLFSSDPFSLTKYCRPMVRRRLRALLQEETFDIVLCDFLVAAGAIPWDWPTPKVLFSHNVEAIIWRRHYEVAKSPFWKALSFYEWKRTTAAERKYLKKADHVFAVSDIDRGVFAKFLDSRRLTVIPTGADTELFEPGNEKEIPNSLVFSGSLDWLPNEDGIIYFSNEILPLIRRQVPDVTLWVVGRNPSRRLQDLATRFANIKLTGWVADVRPYLAQGAVYVVPLRIAGGTRLKIFEAMSMAKSVVSTSIGAEGLPVKSGEHLLLADDPASFAECVLRLLGNASYRARVGQLARRLVEQHYSWVSVSKDFADALERVVRQGRVDPACGFDDNQEIVEGRFPYV